MGTMTVGGGALCDACSVGGTVEQYSIGLLGFGGRAIWWCGAGEPPAETTRLSCWTVGGTEQSADAGLMMRQNNVG